MMEKYFNKATQYVLSKTIKERLLLLFVFLLGFYVLCGYLHDESQDENHIYTKQYKVDFMNAQGDILRLAKKYNIATKCLRVFCDSDEFDGDDFLAPSSIDSKLYYLYFSCDSLSCYEFIREVENLPLVFIKEIRGFNVELISINDDFEPEYSGGFNGSSYASQQKSEREIFLDNFLGNKEDMESSSNSNQEYLESRVLPIKWRQDIKMTVQVDSIKYES